MTNDAIITFPYSQKNMDYAHGEALKEDAERGAEIYTVMPSGLVITRAMLWEEMRETLANAHHSWTLKDPNPLILGVNASSNMFA